MIDTAPKINKLTKRLTEGEGHVVRHGDVRRVRKVIVDSPTSRTLRGQSPAQTSFPRTRESMGQLRRTETVRNRLTQKPTTKPLPFKTAEAQTQEPRNRQSKKRGQSPQLNASVMSFPQKREPKGGREAGFPPLAGEMSEGQRGTRNDSASSNMRHQAPKALPPLPLGGRGPG